MIVKIEILMEFSIGINLAKHYLQYFSKEITKVIYSTDNGHK